MDEKHQPCVLVVDDDSVNRAQWKNAFNRAGFRVMETSSRTDALTYLESTNSGIHLLVTGVMRDAEGALLVANVAEQHPTFPFIVIASAANPVGIQGHFAILLEPVSDKKLIETAQALLSK